jgi:Tfp pilus assembly protein PilF
MAATTSSPAALEAALQQAMLHQRAGRLSEAERAYRDILRVLPDHPGINNNLGLALKDQGRLDEAAATFRRVLTRKPDDVLAQCNLGNVLRLQGKLDEAAACYRRAIATKPDMALAHQNLGTALCESGQLDAGLAAFRRHAELAYGAGSARASGPVAPHKTRHDQEQRDYLKDSGVLGAAGDDVFRLEPGDRLSGRAINSDASGGGIATRWRNSTPQLVVIDNLLTEAALGELRRFCWGSTIWRKVYADGYLGALPEYGFACPLLAQISEELRSTYPEILEHYPLLQFWGFKYDNTLSGIKMHADFAAVNVNFWITADEANLDPEHGGLVIWDVPAPLDWDFAKYNDSPQLARDFLAQSGAHPVTVPHRANRAVIFDSDLFHETDRISFKEGYRNRRINITLLYGRRENAKEPARRG